MKKLVLAAVACAFIAGPALAGEFNVEQTKMLDKIAGNMETCRDDAGKMDFLIQKKECVEKATDIDGLKVCLAHFPPEKLEAMTCVC